MILTYHELTPTRSRYVYSATTAEFEEHLQLIGSFSRCSAPPIITFDDGHLSQYLYALPLLEQNRQKGIFFVTAGWTDTKLNYMTGSQLRELVRLGHEVQAHGWSHALLTHCTPAALDEELRRTKHFLEDRLGTAVESISMPGGRWNARVLSACHEEGYRSVYTSDPYARVKHYRGMTVMGRAMVRKDMGRNELLRLLNSADSLWSGERIRFRLKQQIKALAGDHVYHTLWRWVGHARQTSAVHPE